MAIKIDHKLTPQKLVPKLGIFFDLSGQKILSIEKNWRAAKGTPVFTVKGQYTTRGWTEWTQGFQFGSAVLQYDATGDERFLKIGRRGTVKHMASHVSHIGVHDHGFNNVSTYGNLRRLMREGRIAHDPREMEFYELALKVSGAVQAARWTDIPGGGYIYSFNGPHSLFIDTIRSLRSLAVAHQLGHALMGERDRKISLLERLVRHAEATAAHGVYYGEGRDAYDVRGRTAHESIFNLNDSTYRCPNSQQGYSPFSTWTRGLAWAICGYAEQLEFFRTLTDAALKPLGGRRKLNAMLLKAATATADFYIGNSCTDGVPAWDTGAPQLHRLGNYLAKRSNSRKRFRTGRFLCGGDRGAGAAPLGQLPDQRRQKSRRHALSPSRLDHRQHSVAGAVPLHDCQASGLGFALDLSSSQWLGPYPARQQNPLRRKLDVGRLPRARIGANAPSRGSRRVLPDLFRLLIHRG